MHSLGFARFIAYSLLLEMTTGLWLLYDKFALVNGINAWCIALKLAAYKTTGHWRGFCRFGRPLLNVTALVLKDVRACKASWVMNCL